MAVVGDAVDVLLTLNEVKNHPGINGDDDELQLYIDAVAELFEEIAGPIMPRTVTQKVTRSGTVLLKDGRVASITSVLRGSQEITDYTLNMKAGTLDGYLAGATVTYVAGFEQVPGPIKLAALYAVRHAAESDEGAAVNNDGEDVFVVSRGNFLTERVEELLAPYITTHDDSP